MKTGDLVIVDTDGGKPGTVAYVCADGYVGVALVNERGRVDEWPPEMVAVATPKGASDAARKFVKTDRA